MTVWLLVAVMAASCRFEPPSDPGKYHPCSPDGACPHPDRCSCLAGWVCVPDDPGRDGPEDCFPDCTAADQCDDLNPCTNDKCDTRDGVCLHDPAPDGTACDDGDDCTEGDACRDGVCRRGTEYVCACQRDQDCDDLDPCTRDVCDPDSGSCLYPAAPDGTACSDDDPCTGPDTCQGGSCQPGPWTCDCATDADCNDDEACTDDICDQNAGTCRFQPVADGTACEDGDPCTGGDNCQGGVCRPGPNGVCAAEDCDDDGFDEDGDGLTDCHDMECFNDAGCAEPCGDESMFAITCDQQRPGDTTGAENNLSWYSCVPWDETGGEHVYQFTPDEASEVTVRLVGQDGFDPDLFVLHPDCAQDDCKGHADMGAIFYAPAGTEVFLVVDGYEGEEGEYVLDVRCVPMPEICVNGTDDDLDGAIDCQDDDCQEAPACLEANLCAAPRIAQCGQVLRGDTTHQEPATTDLVDVYGGGCGPSTAEGPETAWAFDAPFGDTLTVELFPDPGTSLGLYVLENCDPMSCIRYGAYEVTFELSGVSNTRLLVDGPEGGAGAYTLAVACATESCGNLMDDDLDGFTDCADPDCHGNASCGDELGDNCVTGVDEDADGATDCDDAGCTLDAVHCPEDEQCRPVQEVGCEQEFDLNTSGPQSTDVVNRYENGMMSFMLEGPESAVSFRPAGTGPASLVLKAEPASSTGDPPELIVLQNVCEGAQLLEHGAERVDWQANEGNDYYLVLDAHEKTVANVQVFLDCGFEDCANGVDDDGDGRIDCADTECGGTTWCPDGTCTPGQTVACGDTMEVSPVELENRITYYPLCSMDNGGTQPHHGGEIVWHFQGGSQSKAVSVTQDVGQVDSDWLFVLEDDCDGLRCVGCGQGQAEFIAKAGRSYYLVLEHGSGEMVEITVTCTDAPEDCFNGVDDDADGQTDCDDVVCQDDPRCIPDDRCQPVGDFWLQCGDWVVGDTSGSVSTDNIDMYWGDCAGSPAGAPEVVVPFVTDQDRPVNLQLGHPEAIDLDLYLLQGDCTPEACVQYGAGNISFQAVQDRVYLIAVDGPEGNAGTFDLRVTCD